MALFECEKCGATRETSDITPEGFLITKIQVPPCRMCGGHLVRSRLNALRALFG